MKGALFSNPSAIWRFIVLYLLLNGVARLLILPHTLWIDEAEQVYMSQWLSPAAFEIQPPLYSWIHYAAFQITCPSMLFVQTFKISVILLTYLGVYRLLQRTIPANRTAQLLALASLAFIPQLWDETLTRTNTILVTMASVWAMYFFVRLTQEPRWYFYAAFGAMLGIGFLSKYTIVLGMVAMGTAALTLPNTRKAILHPLTLVAALVFLLVVAPHLGWFLQHLLQSRSNLETELGDPQQLSFAATTGKGLASFLSNSFGFIGIWLLLMLLLLGKELRRIPWRQQDLWTRFLGRYLLIVVALMLVALFVFGMTTFYERYFQPFYIFIPVWLFASVQSNMQVVTKRAVWLQYASVVAFIALFYFNHLLLVVQPLQGVTDVMHIPYRRIAAQVQAELQPGDVVVTNRIRMAGNLKMNLGKQPVLWTDDSLHFREELQRPGVNQLVYVWHSGDERIPSKLTAADAPHNNFDSSFIKWIQVPYGTPADRYYEVGVIRLPRR